MATFAGLGWVVTVFVCLLWLWCLGVAWWRSWYAVATESRRFARRAMADVTEQQHAHASRRKPEWVIQEVLRLKALMWKKGSCRKIADTFNGLHTATSACTVGKTFVSECLKANQYALACLRKEMRNRQPLAVAQSTLSV
jgi:hypothetical protein